MGATDKGSNSYFYMYLQWSYGILLWELLTRGVTPYPDVEAKDLKSYLDGGHRLKKPRQCPENV